MLQHYRVLDLTDERGQMAGWMLASLGADVLLVEPPGGSSARSLGPWAGDEPGTERSLWFWGYNRAKRSIELDLDTTEGREALAVLAAGADAVIESSGLDLSWLRDRHPHLVTASITAFGSDGPKAAWPNTDLTVWASGMALTITGDADRAPVRPSLPQAFLHASADAAVGVLIALAETENSGLGQHVEISAQQSSLQATQSMVLATPNRGTFPLRMGGGVRVGPLPVRLVWPCRDGHVSITFLFGVAIGPFTRRLFEWMHDEGVCDAATRDKDWINFGNLLATGAEPVSEYLRCCDLIETFTLTRTKDELMNESLERRLLIAPVTNIQDVVESKHFQARDFWDEVDDAVISPTPIICNGPYAQLTGTPMPRRARAPRLGEHTKELLEEAAAAASAKHARATAQTPASTPTSTLPLAGLKVLDLMWVMAGPAMSRVLADYGATVVRVESVTRIETARTISPFVEDRTDPEWSSLYHNMNTGKLGIGVNLSKPEGRALVKELVQWADVVCESFSPRAMTQWGLDYESLRAVNPSVVMISSCIMGQYGPWASFAGYGNLGAAIAGFYEITGWPDRPPAGPFGAYTDYVSPRFGLCALLAALDHRRRTGEGQYIDFSQSEAGTAFLTPAILDYTVNGRVMGRNGNADEVMSPHGVYPAKGDDRWVAIACADDEQWKALAGAIGCSELSSLGAAERRSRRQELDSAVAAWTATRDISDIEATLVAAGVPVHGAQNSPECWADPQLHARKHFVTLEHQVCGPIVVEGSRMRLSRTPARVERAAPALGQDTYDVLTEVFGMSDERVGDLFANEILE